VAEARLVDTHAHLDHPQFDADRAAVIERARAAGVIRILTIGTDLPSSRAAIALAAQHADIYATVGVHPHEANALTPPDGPALAELRALAAHPKVVAIGEIGLDFYRDRAPRDQQQAALAAQLELAAELGLPVVVHCREAEQPLMERLRRWAAEHPTPRRGWRGVLHAFPGDAAMAAEAAALGFMVALGGPVTFANARRLHALVPQLPLDHLLLETDAPYLAPHPQRGQRNEPAWIVRVAEAIARLRGDPLTAIAERTTANAMAVFGLSAD